MFMNYQSYERFRTLFVTPFRGNIFRQLLINILKRMAQYSLKKIIQKSLPLYEIGGNN